ncbi:MAG: tyrosine-type recombinase/integrase [Rhodospirillaceae bacterium]|nr:tyrosine-type recombinase/integrase [Rhodospirillaceae bacterium]
MPKADKILNAVTIRNLTKPGRYSDGRGLYLVVAPAGTKKWVLRIVVNRVRRDFGLGSAMSVPLAEVRERADEYRRMIRQGLDPKEEKEKRLAASQMPAFREAALSVHNENKPTWKNAKHGQQWLNTLRDYAFPDLGDTAVDKIDGPAVHGVLLKIWLAKPETARRVRQRIGTVLDWCHAKGYRPHALDMRGLSRGLPKQPKKSNHHAALPYDDVPEFIAALRAMDHIGVSVRLAFEFLILTAGRSGEVREARWSEIDLDERLWTIPAQRMKMDRKHVVPLSDRAVEVLDGAAKLRRKNDADELVFKGRKPGRPLSDMTLTMLLRRTKVEATAHGFRSSFRDWAAEQTSFPREVCEAALAHAVENKVEGAYRRTDFLAKRRDLMQAWARHCSPETEANVVELS